VEEEKPAETISVLQSMTTTQGGELQTEESEDLPTEEAEKLQAEEGEELDAGDGHLSLDNERESLPVIPDTSSSSDVRDSGLAYLWSICFQWLNDERCRAETAFSGWDH
jgi:hypothetical protein